MNEIRFVDTTLRDGQMSLWATNMTTAMMLPVVEAMDRAGFEAMELLAAAFFKKLVRELRDDPWERIDLVRQRARNTPLRAIRGRYMSAFHITPQSMEDLFVERLAAHGIRQVRISDCSNTVAVWRQQVESARKVGLETIVNLIFSESPKHTDDYYARKTREAAALKPERICLKDPGGLLTPARTLGLVPLVLQNADGITVELHTHCNTGLGALCCLEAIKLGITSVNTAIPPLADGSSNPSLFNVARNARILGFKPMVDDESLKPVETHFSSIARRQGLPLGVPAPYDAYHYVHQVPGGMISNLRHQLAKVGLEAKLDEVLEETARVRADFGYPIMVTPYSQFVGSQAAMNVMLGERYKVVSDEVIQYALGLWGEEESAAMDPNLRDRLLGMPRAKELSHWQPPQPSLGEIRGKFAAGISDDELLLCYLAGADEAAAMRAAPRSVKEVSAAHPVAHLIGELAKHTHCSYIQVRRGALSVELQKGRGRP
jgi:oxaloacetate decarboxylase (Na+ extruding) subunit alpha